MKPGNHLIEEDGTHSPNCFPCRIKSVSFAPSAMPTRSPVAAKAKNTDPALAKDLDAYKRLRRNGTQPSAVNGAYNLETQAQEKFEITTGRLVADPVDRHRYAQAFAEMPKPSSTPIVREDA
jgi:hypothetical protein